MKKQLAKLGIIGLTVVSLAACSNSVDKPVDNDDTNTPPSTEQPADSDQTNQDEDNQSQDNETQKSQLILDLETVIIEGGDAADVATYLQDNIHNASPEEADQMVEILLMMQTDLIQKGHEGIFYEGDYMTALNDTMGGVLDPQKVDAIEDETVKAFYKALIASDLTIVRYEETPVVETNWLKIIALDTQFTDDFQMVVDYQDYRDLLRTEDVAALTDRIYAIETQLDKKGQGFGREQLVSLYDEYVSWSLVGPEGSYLYRLTTPEDSYYAKMQEAVKDKVNSGFAQTALNLMKSEKGDFNDLITIIDNYRKSNPYGSRHWQEVVVVNDTGNVNNTFLKYSGQTPEIDDNINGLLTRASEELLNDAKLKENYDLVMYKTFESKDYATIYLYVNYTLPDGNVDYMDKAVNIDLQKGELLTLETLLQAKDQALLEKVNTLSGGDFTVIPEFELTETAILLNAKADDAANTRHAVITRAAFLRETLSR